SDCGPSSTPSCAGGRSIPVTIEQTHGDTGLSIRIDGSLPYDHRFLLKVSGVSLRTAGTGSAAYDGPSEFLFATRARPATAIGATEAATAPVRDLLKFGNLLLVGTSAGEIKAIDVSDASNPRPFAKLRNGSDDVRAFATDGHGRLFYNHLEDALW